MSKRGLSLYLRELRTHHGSTRAHWPKSLGTAHYAHVLFVFVLLWLYYEFLLDWYDLFTHSRLGCFIEIGAIATLPSCQKSNLGGYWTYTPPQLNATKHRKPWAYSFGRIAYCTLFYVRQIISDILLVDFTYSISNNVSVSANFEQDDYHVQSKYSRNTVAKAKPKGAAFILVLSSTPGKCIAEIH